MNAIFQALAYVLSVYRKYSEKRQRPSKDVTGKVVDLFYGMYTGRYNVMLMKDIVESFKITDPLTFWRPNLQQVEQKTF